MKATALDFHRQSERQPGLLLVKRRELEGAGEIEPQLRAAHEPLDPLGALSPSTLLGTLSLSKGLSKRRRPYTPVHIIQWRD